jgi:hypothetical protein
MPCSRDACEMVGRAFTLDGGERGELVIALYERQEVLRANLDRVAPAILTSANTIWSGTATTRSTSSTRYHPLAI